MKFAMYVFIGCAVMFIKLISNSDFREAACDYTDCMTTLASVVGMAICVMIWPLILASNIVLFFRSALDEKK